MNYLAHLHIAATTDTSLVGNFLGDFVKGNDFKAFDSEVIAGIKLHRQVDSFTDRHDVVKELKALFPKELRRMAGVCIDIWFDYLLVTHNDNFAPSLKSEILEKFYAELAETVVPTTRFQRVKSSLLQHRWLMDYEHHKTTLQAFYSIESRLKHRIKFADASYQFLTENSQTLEHMFLSFYPELLAFSQRTATNLLFPNQLAEVHSTE